MRTPTRRWFAAPILFLTALAVCGLSTRPGLAEIGAGYTGIPAPKADVYVLGSIEDGPTPFDRLWRRFSLPGGSRIVLNPNGEANGDGPPSILSNSTSGLIAVAWARNSANGFDVVLSRFENGAWTEPQVIAGSPANELDPHLVLGADGVVHLFYWVDGTTPQVLHTQAPADLSSWSSPVMVSQPGQPACRPAGVFWNGVLRVAHEVHDFGYGNSPRQVVLSRYEGGVFVPEIVAMTSHLGEVRPQVHSHAGQLWVDWVDAETTGGSGEVAWTRLDAEGHWVPIQYEPYANYEEREYLVRGGVRMKAIQ